MTRNLLPVLLSTLCSGVLQPVCLYGQNQENLSITKEYAIQTWSTEFGAPVNIYTLNQTPDGFLWLGADEGVFRFDGIAFRAVGPDTMKKVNYECRTLLVLRDSSVLCGFNTGDLIRFRQGIASLFCSQRIFHNKALSALFEAPDGTIWIGTDGAGLFAYTDGSFENITTAAGLPSNVITALCSDQEGVIWAGTQEGLARIQNNTCTTLRTQQGLSRDFILSLYADSSGLLWIGTHGGMNVLDSGRIRQVTSEILSLETDIYSIAEDPSGDIWFAAYGDGLFRISRATSQIMRITDQEGLPANLVRCVLVDRESTIWAGQGANFGLTQLQKPVVRIYSTINGFSGKNILPLYRDARDQVWIGTGAGNVDCFSRGIFTSHTESAGFGTGPILTITSDREGNLWIGGEDSLILYNGRSKCGSVHFSFPDRVSYHALFTARSGDIWIGTDLGIIRIRGADTLRLDSEGGLTDNRAYCFAEDAGGGIWIGTPDGGLNRFYEGRIDRYTTVEGLSSNCILCLYIDTDGIVWAGAANGGLNRIDPESGKIISFGEEAGLDYVITQIEEDEFGYLWLGAFVGIISVDKQSLQQPLEDGRKLDVEVFSYSENGRSFMLNAAMFPSSCELSNGTIWFPSDMGIAAVEPARAHKRVPFPSIVIESLVVNGDPKPLQSSYVFSPGVIHLEVNFTAPTFISPERIRFRYRLVGYDEEWMNYGDERKAHYTKIPFGHYTFEVQCTNFLGKWSDKTLVIPIRIKPYFYQRVWFLVICLAVGLFILFAFYKYRIKQIREKRLEILVEARTRQLKELNRELDQRVLDRTTELAAANQELEAFSYSVSHDLRAPVRRIEGLIEALSDEYANHLDDTGKDYLNKVADSSKEMGALIEEFLKLARIARQEIDKTDLDLSVMVSEISEDLIQAEPERGVTLTVEPGIRANGDPRLIRIALQNILNNAWKYTGKSDCPEVTFGCIEEGNQRTFFIRDNGIGFDMGHYDKLFTPFLRLHSDDQFTGTGIGLATVKRIILKHGGKIWARSEPGKGSTFFFTF